MKIYHIANKNRWKGRGQSEHSRIDSRIQYFFDKNPSFADVFTRATKKRGDGFSLEDKNMFLTNLGRHLRKYYFLSEEQVDAYTQKVNELEEELQSDN